MPIRRRKKNNRLSREEPQGATVSICKLGMYGVDFFTVIIPYGQSALSQ